jgi:hypothetical protein
MHVLITWGDPRRTSHGKIWSREGWHLDTALARRIWLAAWWCGGFGSLGGGGGDGGCMHAARAATRSHVPRGGRHTLAKATATVHRTRSAACTECAFVCFTSLHALWEIYILLRLRSLRFATAYYAMELCIWIYTYTYSCKEISL